MAGAKTCPASICSIYSFPPSSVSSSCRYVEKHTDTHSELHGKEAPGPQQSWSLGIQELVRPAVQSSFSPHVSHSDEDPIKLPPNSGALQHPPCQLCMAWGEQAVPAMHPGQPAVSSSVPQGFICLLTQAPVPAPGPSKDCRREGLMTPLSLPLPLPFFLFLLSGRQPILFIALDSRVIG